MPALVALGVSAGDAAVEQAFLETLRLDEAAETGTVHALTPAWYAFFHSLAAPEWLGRPFSIGVAWLLLAAALAVLVAGGIGVLHAALALLLLCVHPALWDLGALQTPWLPAAAFTMLAFAFLEGMVLPTQDPRRRHAGRWLPRAFAIVGCGLSFALACSAVATIAWYVFIVLSAFLVLSILSVALALWRNRHRTLFLRRLVLQPWPIVRRAFPWAVAWFFVQVVLLWVYGTLEEPSDAVLAALSRQVATAGTWERVLAWLALPGLVVLALREGLRLGFRSYLDGGSVLFVCLVPMWLQGPALDAHASPLARLLGAPVFAAAASVWLPARGRGPEGK